MGKYKRKIIIIDKDFQLRFVRKFLSITALGTLAAILIILIFYYFTYRHDGKHLVRYLVEVGLEKTDINIEDNNGKTPLHTAIDAGQFAMTKYLIEVSGANLRAKDDNGNRPLHSAVDSGNTEIVTFILKLGLKLTDINAENNDSMTPLHIACKKSFPEIALLLIESHANMNIKDKFGKLPADYAKQSNNEKLIEIFK